MDCNIVQVGGRRDGGHRYWCVAHKANATAKYGVAAERCVAADDEPIPEAHSRDLVLSAFPGGVALWGAVPPAYDTTLRPLDRGIHVHARMKSGGVKFIDETYRRLSVQVRGDLFSDRWIEVDELDAINFMVSSVFGFEPIYVECSLCGFPHLDRDWFAVHSHRKHLCHGCGRQFTGSTYGVGNPLCALREEMQIKPRPPALATQAVDIKQADYPGGIQLWGSNPAIVWTADKEEREGIHLHCFKSDDQALPMPDGTFQNVVIDGVPIDPTSLRLFMAQQAMPHLNGRVLSLTCPKCLTPHLDVGELAYTPHIDHECTNCGSSFRSPTQIKKTISNPFVAVRSVLATHAVRALREDKLGLRPETI